MIFSFFYVTKDNSSLIDRVPIGVHVICLKLRLESLSARHTGQVSGKTVFVTISECIQLLKFTI